MLSPVPDPGVLEAGLFQRIFRNHAASVAVITVADPTPTGFTATSLVSLAAEPPLISFNISRAASSWPALKSAHYVGIHLLAEHQHDVATVFSTSGIDRFGQVRSWSRGPHRLPIIDDVAAWMVVRVHTRIPAADHVIVVGEVLDAAHRDAAPLVYHNGRYTGLAEPA